MQALYLRLTVGSLVYAASAQPSDTVRSPPQIKHAPPVPLYYKPGSEVNLPCAATGTPKLTYNWYHNRIAMTESKMNQTEDGLTVKLSTINDTGEYQCYVTNSWGTSISQIFKIKTAYITYYQEQNGAITNTATIGKHLILTHHIRSDPQATYQWKMVDKPTDQSGRDVQTSKRVIQGINGNLYFTSIIEKDARGNQEAYRVVALNNILDEDEVVNHNRVFPRNETVTRSTRPIILYPTTSNHNVTVLEGQELKIQCIFGEETTDPGSPVDVTWQAPNKQFDLDQSNTVLRVNDVTLNHAGLYKCTGTNSMGASHAHILVDIETVPKLARSIQPSRWDFFEGETASFDCQSSADTKPPARISWLFNAVPRTDKETSTKILSLDYGERLIIDDLNKSDTKIIQCLMSNKYEEVYSEAVLNVFERIVLGEIPISQDIDENVAGVVNFTCSCQSDSNTTCSITWTHNGEPIANQTGKFVAVGNILRVETNNDPRELVVGNYTCTASDGSDGFASHTAILTIRKQLLQQAVDPVQPSTYYSLIAIIGCSVVLLVLGGVFVGVYLERRQSVYMVEENERLDGTNTNNSFVFYEIETGTARQQKNEFKPTRNSLSTKDRKLTDYIMSELETEV